MKEASALATSTQPAVNVLGHALAMRSLMAQGRLADAAAHVAPLETAAPPTGSYGVYADLQSGLARGEYELRTGKQTEGAKRLRDVMTRARGQRSPDGWIEGLFMLEAVFNIARATEQWELAADASARLMQHDKAYAGSQEAARVISARAARRLP